MKAMIFAAGLGTRLKPFTDQHPKALAVVNGKSLLQRNIEYLADHGIQDIIINIHHFPDQIKHAIESNHAWGANIAISDESSELLETGGGLKKASWFFSGDREPFVLINCDILTNLDLQRMITYHKTSGALATLAVMDRSSSRYFLFNENNLLCGWENVITGEEHVTRNEPILRPLAFSGVHVISPEIFSLMNHKGKFSITETYLDLSSEQTILGFEHDGDKFLDIGKPGSIEEAEKLFP